LPCLGLHPDRFADAAAPPSRAAIDATLALVRAHAGVLAGIGEIGLDQWAVKDPARRAAAEELLAAFAALGRELDLTLNVHSRSAGERTLDVLRAAGAGRVLMHAFDGRASLAVRAADDGTVFSIPPSVVRSPQKQKLVRRLPLEALVLESDAPVLGPTPGERNEPANLALTRDYLAAAHGVSAERVAEMTTATAWRLFPRLAAALG
jgi:TatD DNase family protein